MAGLVARSFSDLEQVETLMLATYLKAWRSAPQYSAAQGHAQAWILTIAWNHALAQVLTT